MTNFNPTQNYAPTAGGAVPGTANSTGVDQTLGITPQEAVLPIIDSPAILGPPNPNVPGAALGHPDTATQPTQTLRDALNAWNTMDPAQLEQLQRQLYDGGFYPRTYYTRGQEPPYGDLNDTAGFAAYRSLLRTAASSKRSLSDVLDAGGAYKGLASQGPSAAVTGLFHEYPLSDPAQLRDDVTKAAVDVLGHNLSPADRDALVNKIVGLQQAKGQEQAAAKSAAITAQAGGTAQAAGLTAAGPGTGQPTNTTVAGSGQTREDFAKDVLAGIGAPTTAENIRAMTAWMQAEGGTAAFNPMNTTQPASGATDYNSVGVKNFTSWQQGVQATIQTLQNGHYPNIIAALQQGNNAGAVAAAVGASPWGTSGQLMAQVLGTTLNNAPVSTQASGGGPSVPTPTTAVPGIPIQDVNAPAEASEQIRAAHPAEAYAHDSVTTYQWMLDAMRKVG